MPKPWDFDTAETRSGRTKEINELEPGLVVPLLELGYEYARRRVDQET